MTTLDEIEHLYRNIENEIKSLQYYLDSSKRLSIIH
jgi:hypothetical protein